MCKSAVLYSRKDYVLGDALRYICRNEKVNLTYALTFPELLHHVISAHPEVIFFDAETINFRHDMYLDFVNTRIFEVPKIVILTAEPEKFSFSNPDIVILDKRNYADEVVKMLADVEEKKSKGLNSEKIEEVKGRTTKLLNELGVTTKYLGYEYIKELVVDIIADRRMLKSFNTKLYPKIAVKYNTQVNNIERNIRNAIGVAINRCKNKTLFDDICGRGNLLFSNTVPSNKQFITWLVDKVG